MNRVYLALIILLLAAAVALMLAYQHGSKEFTSFTFNSTTYRFTSVATDYQEWTTGLMNQTVTNATFELFVFPEVRVYSFWMKNTYYPLDIIWINQGRIVYIANATPCSWYSKNQSNCIVYNNSTPADLVIEAKSGFVNKTGMKVGDSIQIS